MPDLLEEGLSRMSKVSGIEEISDKTLFPKNEVYTFTPEEVLKLFYGSGDTALFRK